MLVPGGRAPTVVTESMIEGMRAGSVVVDVAIDQGGCIEGIHETTHTDPVYVRHDVIHYAVGNIPGRGAAHVDLRAHQRTLPYLLELATKGLDRALQGDPALAHGLNTRNGKITHPAVAEALGIS